ncbi:MAG: 3'(2'),5'-bisphosphate nucleotidase CysQ [Candidatus Marinimicrobia bacterium]|nr:3'(2'),5'-bisphosphate nucleotidase CysQ [Candidatus Neomarinimicrobiota bacterium]MBT7376996.1 3'(2'),5'-bisphosphate nucleotidase CysQ [Candidatus Neomarinimicrobiota bacterium]|tara:strand:- start:7497 stop:8264 length:768 start_codon:yes stop_codon:yes gene_type:complete
MNQILLAATTAAYEAGDIIHSFFLSEYEVKMKGKGNPVTEADIAADDILKKMLISEFPEYGWLSEETRDTPHRLTKKRVWVVDPIDGTKEFVEGIPNFVVSIGLVENGIPILGVIHNPINKDTYTAISGGGVFFNGNQTSISDKTEFSLISMLNSRSETRQGLWESYTPHFKELIPIGSIALKLAMVAAHQTDMVASLKPKNEWDICAGHCLINEAGGKLLTIEGKGITYNNADTLITPGLVAGNESVVNSFIKL